MKKLFLCIAICFGVFVCQDVVAQSLNLENTPITKQVVTPTNGGNTNATQLSNAPLSTPVNLNSVQAPERIATPVNNNGGIQNAQLSATSLLKNATPVQLHSQTNEFPHIQLGRAVIEQ